MKIIRFCLPYLYRHKFKFFVYFITSIGISIIYIALTYILGEFIDKLSSVNNDRFIIIYCIIFSLLSILRLILGYWNNLSNSELLVIVAYEISSIAIEHIHLANLSETNKFDAAYFNHRISQDAGSISGFTMNSIVVSISNIMSFIIITCLMLTISKKITLILLAFLSIYIIAYKALKKPLGIFNLLMKEKQNAYFTKMQEQLQFNQFIKTHSIYKFFTKRLYASFDLFRVSFNKYQRISFLFNSLDGIIMLFAQIVLFIFGGVDVLNQKITIGQFAIFTGYFKILLSLSSYFFQLCKNYQDSLVSYSRLYEIFSLYEEENGTVTLKKIESIDITNLRFSYGDKLVLKDICLHFETGNIYSIIGNNGIGKSTLMQIIIGLYSNKIIGNIEINRIPLNKCDMKELRLSKIGVTEQEPPLFNDSIYNNLYIGGRKVENECFNEILEALNLFEYINNLPNGLQTVISSKNNNLSGGEKQKISIARVLLKNPDIMIFDEPTSALDQNTTRTLMKYLVKIKKDKIIILVTHNLEVLNMCDKIIELKSLDS